MSEKYRFSVFIGSISRFWPCSTSFSLVFRPYSDRAWKTASNGICGFLTLNHFVVSKSCPKRWVMSIYGVFFLTVSNISIAYGLFLKLNRFAMDRANIFAYFGIFWKEKNNVFIYQWANIWNICDGGTIVHLAVKCVFRYKTQRNRNKNTIFVISAQNRI